MTNNNEEPIYQSKKRGSYIHKLTTRIFVLNSADKLLLIKEKRQVDQKNQRIQYSVPGGNLEDGESLVENAMREVKEETNYDIEIAGILGLINWFRKRPRFAHETTLPFGNDIIMVGRLIGGTPIPQKEENILDIIWVNEIELREIEQRNELDGNMDYLIFYENSISRNYLSFKDQTEEIGNLYNTYHAFVYDSK